MSWPTRAPAAFGQLYVLRHHELPGNGGGFPGNQAYVVPIPPGTSLARAEAAWCSVVQNNEGLRTTFDLSTPRPTQLIHAPGSSIPLPHRDLALDPDGDGSDAAWDHAAELAAQAIAIGSEFPVRAFIGLESGRPGQLGFAVHHSAADHAGVMNIAGQFQAALSGALEPVGQPSALAREQQGRLAQRDQTIGFWAGRWGDFSVDDPAGADTSPRHRAHLYSRAGMRAAAVVSADLGVSLQSVVLAVTNLAIGQLLGRPDFTVGLVAGNRVDPKWAGTVTSMFQTTPILVRADPGLPPAAFLRETAVSGYEAYLNGIYDVDRLRARLAADGAAEPDLLFDTYFSFLGDSGDDIGDDHPWSHSVEVSALPARVGPRLQFRIATGSGMHIQLRASEDFVPTERLGAAAASIEAGLISLAEHRPSRVDEIRLDPLREVVAA